MSANAKIEQMRRVATALRTAALAGANAYANGNAGTPPIVDRHFTAGNQQRYGWPPLSRDYFLTKQRAIKPNVKRGIFTPSGGGRGSKLDPNAQFRSVTGVLTGVGSAKNAPMLVLTGTLRKAVTAQKHEVRSVGDGSLAIATFRNLPDYGSFLHTGTARMPQRSPVAPNALDKAEVEAVMRRHIDAAMGRGGKVPVTQGSIPGRMRLV